MRVRLERLTIQSLASLFLCVSLASGQGIRVIKLLSDTSSAPMELTPESPPSRPLMLPPPQPAAGLHPSETASTEADSTPYPEGAVPVRARLETDQTVIHRTGTAPHRTDYPTLPEPAYAPMPNPAIDSDRVVHVPGIHSSYPTAIEGEAGGNSNNLPHPKAAPSPASKSTPPPQRSVPTAPPIAPHYVTPGMPYPREDHSVFSTDPHHCDACCDQILYWGRAEALLWWMRSQTVPPLVTSGLPGTQPSAVGVLDGIGTSVILGDRGMNGDAQGGARFVAGFWFSPDQRSGISADYFFLGRQTDTKGASFDGIVPLARPFVNALNENNAADLIGYHGRITGRVIVTGTQSAVEGTGALLRRQLLVGHDPQGVQVYRLEAVGGYRFLNVGESLTVLSETIDTASIGTMIRDEFQTRNTFHGFDFGFVHQIRRGSLTIDLVTKLALGGVDQRVSIFGDRSVVTPDGRTTARSGGWLAHVGNSGVHRRTEFALIPELEFNLGWQVNSFVRLYAGYNLLFLTDAVRPGDHINLSLNPRLLAGATPPVITNPPSFAFDSTDLWLQGLKMGVEVSY